MSNDLAKVVAQVGKDTQVWHWPKDPRPYRVCVRSRRRGRPYHTHSTHEELTAAISEAEQVAGCSARTK